MRCQASGFALAVVLVLLLGLSLLAVAGFGAAVAAVALASYAEQAALAFQAAEAGNARTMASPADRLESSVWPTQWPSVTVRSSLQADPPDEPGSWPPGFSIGSNGFRRRHYSVLSTGRAGRGAAVALEQGFAVIENTGQGLP